MQELQVRVGAPESRKGLDFIAGCVLIVSVGYWWWSGYALNLAGTALGLSPSVMHAANGDGSGLTGVADTILATLLPLAVAIICGMGSIAIAVVTGVYRYLVVPVYSYSLNRLTDYAGTTPTQVDDLVVSTVKDATELAAKALAEQNDLRALTLAGFLEISKKLAEISEQPKQAKQPRKSKQPEAVQSEIDKLQAEIDRLKSGAITL